MKSFQNSLFAGNTLQTNELSKIKGGAGGTQVEVMVEVTATINGTDCLLYCDRRRKRLGA